MKAPVVLLLIGALLLAGCGGGAAGPGPGSEPDGGGATTEVQVDASGFDQAGAAADLPAALEAGERIVEDLLAALDVDPRERADVRPYRVSLCDEVRDDAPSLVSVTRGIAFPADRTDEVLAQAAAAFEAAGVRGVATVGEDSSVPMVSGVFADDTWQVAATLNREDGIGEVRVNSACLPGELPEPPASS